MTRSSLADGPGTDERHTDTAPPRLEEGDLTEEQAGHQILAICTRHALPRELR